MRNWVNEWVQEGDLYVWRYANPGRHWRGWQFSADPVGCRSIRNLLDRMHGGEPCHRTLMLAPVTDAILNVPNSGYKQAGRFEKLRVEYLPAFEDLRVVPNGEALIMTVGKPRSRYLTAAFAEVEMGVGDFGIATSDNRKADGWMFWPMPYSQGYYSKGGRIS
jgi:hypothetical protein